MVNMINQISKKIEEYRLQKGLTLKELSEITQLLISFLSQVERSSSSLSITSLQRIADALGVPVSEFFQSPVNQAFVVKRNEQKYFRLESSITEYCSLLLGKTEEEMQRIRGDRISMIFQEPMTSLNPVHRVGSVAAEVLQGNATDSPFGVCWQRFLLLSIFLLVSSGIHPYTSIYMKKHFCNIPLVVIKNSCNGTDI